MSLAERYANSIAHTSRARRVTVGGSQTSSKRPGCFPEGAFPAYIAEGDGARVMDVDGNWLVDWICGLGAVPLGYNNPAVNNAIIWQLENGIFSTSLPTTLEAEIAERLVQIIPCAQDHGQVRFVKTGSEACAAAVRIARRATDRMSVLVVGYHGWHDWVMVTSDPHPGIPEEDRPTVHRVPYNDLERIEWWMQREAVAAVMLEPTLLVPPEWRYLKDVVALCTKHGALSIFDEMVCGFRWARAGGQEYFDVVPDMAVFGKGLANGMPLACVVGPERYMRYADVISGTFGGEALSLAAAGAVLGVYEGEEQGGLLDLSPIQHQWVAGQWFLDQCAKLGIPTTGYAVHPKVTYEGAEMALFLQETARRGLLLHPSGFNVSAALQPEDLEITRAALEGAKEVLDSGEGVLEGAVPSQGMLRRTT